MTDESSTNENDVSSANKPDDVDTGEVDLQSVQELHHRLGDLGVSVAEANGHVAMVYEMKFDDTDDGAHEEFVAFLDRLDQIAADLEDVQQTARDVYERLEGPCNPSTDDDSGAGTDDSADASESESSPSDLVRNTE